MEPETPPTASSSKRLQNLDVRGQPTERIQSPPNDWSRRLFFLRWTPTLENTGKSTHGAPEVRILMFISTTQQFLRRLEWRRWHRRETKRQTYRRLRHLVSFHFACPLCSPSKGLCARPQTRRAEIYMNTCVLLTAQTSESHIMFHLDCRHSLHGGQQKTNPGIITSSG